MEESVLEMLGKALDRQRRSVRVYEVMAGAADDDDRPLLGSMRREDRRHYYLLEGIYEELSGTPWRGTRVSFALPKSYLSMLRVMICDKLEAIEYYQLLEQKLECVKQRELMEIIIADQKEQARLLATIYKRYD